MAEEEKGFVIKDRRSFDDKGELRDEAPAQEEKEPVKEEPEKDSKEEESGRPPLPEANFTSLIFSLSSSALVNLGEVPDPNTGKKQKDLQIAKRRRTEAENQRRKIGLRKGRPFRLLIFGIFFLLILARLLLLLGRSLIPQFPLVVKGPLVLDHKALFFFCHFSSPEIPAVLACL